jgi:NADH-ubiquinone oxidoreductase chain 2
MIFISLLIYIVAIALPIYNKQISSILLNRISSIILIYSGALSLNAFYIQSIGSGIGIYSGLFHVTQFSQFFDFFILIIASLILIPRPTNMFITTLSNLNLGTNKDFIKDKLLKTTDLIMCGFESKTFKNGISVINDSKMADGHYLPSVTLASKYSLIILFSTLGSLLLVSSSDLVSIYLSIELQSFGLYILATLFRDSKLATSAGLKYFLLGGLSSCIILLGAGIVYTFTGLTNLESIYALVSVSYDNSVTQGLTLGFVLIMVGLLFKIAAAPLHNWAPDVYDDSPTIVTIWLTIMPKIAILILLSELFIGGIGRLCISNLNYFLSFIGDINNLNIGFNILEIGDLITNLLLITSLLSFLIGTILGLVQSKIKRLLAYSTISHVGFILLALAINTEQSIESFIFYIIQYSLTNLNTFLIILAIGYLFNYSGFRALSFIKEFIAGRRLKEPHLLLNVDKDIRFISELKGQFLSNPLLSISLTICLFSMAGIPPLMGFFAKQMVLYSAIQSGYYFMAIIAIIVSVISASYYLKLVRVLFSTDDIVNKNNKLEVYFKEGTVVNTKLLNDNLNSNHLASGFGEVNSILYISKDNNSPSLIEGLDESIITDKNNSNMIKTNSFKNENVNNMQLVLKGDPTVLMVNSEHTLTNLHSLLISILTLSILFFILKPSILLNSTQLLSLSIYNF